jgi:hypothetical protein
MYEKLVHKLVLVLLVRKSIKINRGALYLYGNWYDKSVFDIMYEKWVHKLVLVSLVRKLI